MQTYDLICKKILQIDGKEESDLSILHFLRKIYKNIIRRHTIFSKKRLKKNYKHCETEYLERKTTLFILKESHYRQSANKSILTRRETYKGCFDAMHRDTTNTLDIPVIKSVNDMINRTLHAITRDAHYTIRVNQETIVYSHTYLRTTTTSFTFVS